MNQANNSFNFVYDRSGFDDPQDNGNQQYGQNNQQARNRYIRLIPWGAFKTRFSDFRHKPVAHQYGSHQRGNDSNNRC
jgi:hypothetical protein